MSSMSSLPESNRHECNGHTIFSRFLGYLAVQHIATVYCKNQTKEVSER